MELTKPIPNPKDVVLALRDRAQTSLAFLIEHGLIQVVSFQVVSVSPRVIL